MKDYQVSNHNLSDFMSEIQDEITEHKLMIVTTQQVGTGKWGMARLWYAWMSTTAKFMANNGAKMPLMIKADGSSYGERAFNSQDAHELFTSHYLGLDKDGHRLSWSKAGSEDSRPATKGERFNALRKHSDWCLEKGILLFTPRDSEYEKLIKEQES